MPLQEGGSVEVTDAMAPGKETVVVAAERAGDREVREEATVAVAEPPEVAETAEVAGGVAGAKPKAELFQVVAEVAGNPFPSKYRNFN